MKFTELKLSKHVLTVLENMGFTEPTEIQEKCIPLIMSGADVVGLSQTGSGKTLAFGIPLIERLDKEAEGIQAIIICPTRELAVQTTSELKKFMVPGITVVPVYGGSDITRQIKALKRASIVVGTPGRMIDHINRRTLKLGFVKTVVLDEADEMLNMGFREDIEKILKTTPGRRQTIMFSATMPGEIVKITKNYMTEPETIEVERNEKAGKTNQFFIQVSKNDKVKAIKYLLDKFKPKLSLIFCNTKIMVDRLTAKLKESGENAVGIHGDKRQSERKRTMDDFKSKAKNMLIATDVAARGIDVKNIEYVFNYDVPNDMDFYVHRIGRTGRATKVGSAYSLVTTRDEIQSLKQAEKQLSCQIKELVVDGLSINIIKSTAGVSDKKQGRIQNGPQNESRKKPLSRPQMGRHSNRQPKQYTEKPYKKEYNRAGSEFKSEKKEPSVLKTYGRTNSNFKSERRGSNDSYDTYGKPERKFRSERQYFDDSKKTHGKPERNFRSERRGSDDSRDTHSKTGGGFRNERQFSKKVTGVRADKTKSVKSGGVDRPNKPGRENNPDRTNNNSNKQGFNRTGRARNLRNGRSKRYKDK